MHQTIILASGSETRKNLLRNAGLIIEAIPARIDEEQIRASLQVEGASSRDVADTLAEMKARKLSERHPHALVIGCDQVIDFEGQIIGKAEDCEALRRQLKQMRGKGHELLSAVVICQAGKPLWRHVGTVSLTMHQISDEYLEDYLDRNWQNVRHAAGGYMLEEEGVRLMAKVDGDYFTVLGLPLVELLSYLGQLGAIAR